jgi:hypothetical protein
MYPNRKLSAALSDATGVTVSVPPQAESAKAAISKDRFNMKISYSNSAPI